MHEKPVQPARSLWPEWVEESSNHGGRRLWSPLATLLEKERDELIKRSGFEPLPHRSRECRCINAKRDDLKTWSEQDIQEIEALEIEAGFTGKGHPRVMFRPHNKR